MPYELKGNCVHRVGSDTPMKCYDNHEDALKYLRALEANVSDATKAYTGMLMQDEVNYIPLSTTKGKACANCRWFIAAGSMGDDGDGDNDCHLVCDHPEPILPTGYCDRYEATPVVEPVEQAPIPVTIVQADDDDMSMNMEAKASAPSSPDDYAYVPDEKKSSTWKLQIQDAEHIAGAITALQPGGYRGQKVEIPASAMGGVKRRISSAIAKLPDGDTKDNLKKRLAAVKEYSEEKAVNEDGLFNRIWERIQTRLTPEKEQQAFTVFKTTDGKDHWIARYTNNFKDRDNEIISEKALSDYVTRVNMGVVPKPELWDWHTKGTRHGQADDVFGIGHFVYAIGHYDDTEIGKQAAAYDRKHAKEIALSHGFTAPKWSFKDGIYEVANTFEITKLPKGRESNPYTKFEEIQKMELTAERESHLRKIYDSKIVDEIKAEAEKHGKALEALEVAYKDFPAVTPTVAKEQDSSTAAMLLELTKAQGEMAQLLALVAQARKTEKEAYEAALTAEKQSHQKAIEGYAAEVSELRKMVNAGPRPASQDAATTVSKVEVDKLKAKAPNADSKAEQYQAFLGLPISPITGGQ